jgi:hypothetical protein
MPAEVHGEATVAQRPVRSVAVPGLERVSTSTSVIDVLDHVLDKGIVIDAWVRVSLIGIDLITVEARVVVASIETYLNRADAVAQVVPASVTLSRPTVWPHPPPTRSTIPPTRSTNLRGHVSKVPPTPKH